jgi:hypothetical protein|tara:strand:+ start:171 stop:545 length:375 start_codon:yes stop_codon:yes gene_type:complete
MEWDYTKRKKGTKKVKYLKPIENTFIVKEMYEQQTKNKSFVLVIHEIKNDTDTNQEFLILEWLNDKEFATRKFILNLKIQRSTQSYGKMKIEKPEMMGLDDLAVHHETAIEKYHKALEKYEVIQ